MNEYRPDSWKLVKITTKKESFYKVFASWSGSYLGSAYWKISSGCLDFLDNENEFLSNQSSGSVYLLDKKKEGESRLITDIFKSFQKKVDAVQGASMEYVSPEDVLKFYKN